MNRARTAGALALGAGVVLVGGILLQMGKTASKLVATPFFKMPLVPDFQRAVFPLDVKIKNPTGGSLKINFPFVELYVGKGEEKVRLGESQAQKKTIEIPAHGQKLIKDILVEIPLLNLAGLAEPVINFIRKRSSSLELTYKVISTADAKLFTIPVNVEDSITISRRAG